MHRFVVKHLQSLVKLAKQANIPGVAAGCRYFHIGNTQQVNILRCDKYNFRQVKCDIFSMEQYNNVIF